MNIPPFFGGMVPGSKVDFHRAGDGSVVLARVDKNGLQAALPRCAVMPARGSAWTAASRDAGRHNVLLDPVSDDPNWADWSIARLEAASLNGPLLINDVIYAELSVRYDRIENLDAFVNAASLEIASIPRAALFLSGGGLCAGWLLGWGSSGPALR